MPVLMGAEGCTNPIPFFEAFTFHGLNNPAVCNTRHTLVGLTATTFASSIMKARRRYPSSGCPCKKRIIASFSHRSSQ